MTVNRTGHNEQPNCEVQNQETPEILEVSGEIPVAREYFHPNSPVATPFLFS
jgi:hypothetical protein